MTKSLKRIIVILCSTLCLFSMSMAVLALPKVTVNAESVTGTTAAVNGLTLNNSVALRINGSGGVRFSGSIEDVNAVDEYGIILADEVTYHKNGELTMEKKNAVASNTNGTMKITTSGTQANFSVALYGIKEKNIARNYVARGYVCVDGVYSYTDIVETNPYELAKRAYTENEITDNAIINDYLERVVDVALSGTSVSVNSPLAGLSATKTSISYDADQVLGYSGINKKVAALYINGTKVAAAYTSLALQDWGSLSVDMGEYQALLNVNGASFENGKVTFDTSSVLPTEKANWLDGVSSNNNIQYLESAYSASAKSVAVNSGDTTITLPVTDYDSQLRSFDANYLRIRLAFTHAGQTLRVNGLNNAQNYEISANKVGENILLSMNKSNELYVLYPITGETVYLGNIPQSIFFGESALSLTVHSASNASIEISPYFLSTSDKINSVGDAVLGNNNLVISGGEKAPEWTGAFTEESGIFTHSVGAVNKGNMQKITHPEKGTRNWKYWRVIVDEYKYTDYSRVTFYLASNYAYKFYNENGESLFNTTANKMCKVAIANDGTVWADDVQVANKMSGNGQIIFHVETTNTQDGDPSAAYYGELHFADFIVLGDKAMTLGKLDINKVSTSGINALNDYSTTYPNVGFSAQATTEKKVDFTGGYGAYIQDIKVNDEKQIHRYFKLTLNKDYRKYDSLSFYLWTNTAAEDGAMQMKVDEKIIGTLPAKETTKITVLNDGLVLINDVSTNTYMQDGATALYIDTKRTDNTYYGEIHVAKAIFVNGIVDTIQASDLALVGVADPYESVKTDTEYSVANGGQNGWFSNGTENHSYEQNLLQLILPMATYDNSTVGWRYFRMNLGIDFRSYDSTSFYMVNWNGRNVTTDVYLQDGTLLVSLFPKPDAETKITIDRKGFVYINDNTIAAGRIKTEKAIFYLDTQNPYYKNTNDSYWGNLLVSHITQDGGLKALDHLNYSTLYPLVTVAEESFPMPFKKDMISSGTFSASGSEKLSYNGGAEMATHTSAAAGSASETSYYRAIISYIGLNYRENDSTEFYVGSNVPNVEFYTKGIYLGKLAVAHTALKIKIDQKGLVYVNDSASFVTKVNGTFGIDALVPQGSSIYAVLKVSQNIWVNGTAASLAASNLSLLKISQLSAMENLTSSVKEVEMTPADVPTWEVRTDAPGIGNGYWVDLDQKYDGTTRTCWNYWRFALNVDYARYGGVSFYISARLTAFDVYMYQTKIVSIPAYSAVRITMDDEGNVYVGDNLTDSVGKMKGEDIVFDLDIHHSAHGTANNNFYGIRFSISDIVTTNEGNLAITDDYFTIGAVAQEVVISDTALDGEITYPVYSDGGKFGIASTSVNAGTDISLDGYTIELGKINGEVWNGYEITVNNPANYDKVTLYLNASEEIDVYANNKLVATLHVNTWEYLTLDVSGNVVFKVDTLGKTVALKTLAFAGGNLGAEKIDMSGTSIKAVALSSILESTWVNSGDKWAYDYQEVGKESTKEKAPLTIGYSYTEYNTVSFTLSSNVGGVSVYTSKNGAAIYSFEANTPVNFTVDNQGYVYVDGAKAGRLTTSTTTLYIGIDTIGATDYDYYTIYVGKDIYLTGSTSIVGNNEIGVGVTEDNLIANGASNYVILKGTSDEYANFAAQEVQSVLEGATGVKLPIATALSTQTEGNNYILIGGNTIPTAVEKDDNPVDKFWNYGTVTQGTVTEEERKLMGITRTLSYSYTDWNGWNRVQFDAVDLTGHDEWLFYARNDTVGTELALFANGGNPNYAISYLEAEGWHEFRLIRNPSGSYGNNTYNVYCNGKIQVHPAWETVERKVVEINGNTSELWWISTSATISYSALFVVERTPVEGAEDMLADVGHSGYALKTMDKNIHVLSNSTFGGMSGALDMLGYMVNYEAYAGDAVYYDTDISTLPVQAFDHSFKALIDERHMGNHSITTSDDDRFRLKLQESGDEWASWTHTTVSQYLPVGIYGSNYSTAVKSNSITGVTLNSTTFANKVGSATADTTYTFEYKKWLFSNYWYYGSKRDIKLSEYGISITGSPSQGDTITVSYSASAAGHTDWYNAAGNQICYGTALGSLTTEGGMYQTFLANVKSQLQSYFLIKEYAGNQSVFVSLGHEDNSMYCDCSKCTKIMNEYGGATGGGFAAIQLQFANNIAKDINAWLPTVGLGDKELKFAILAYGAAGRAVPTKGIELHEDVYVMVAPIESFYNLDIYNEANSGVYEVLTGWNDYLMANRKEGRLIVYNYTLNGMCYLFPTNNVASGSFYAAFADNNVSYVYTQGVANEPTAAFEDLRMYLEAKQMYDSKYSREELIKDFMLNYYDDAKNPTGSGEIMLQFYKELEDHYAKLSRETYDMYKNGDGIADTNGNGFNGYWHCDMFGPMDTSKTSGTAPTYWNTAKLNGFISQIEAAVAAINASSLDSATKATLIARVERELIFPMFVSVAMSYANYYDANDLNNTGTKDAFYNFDVKLTAAEKAEYVTKLQALTQAIGMDKIYESSSLLWRNGLGIASNSISEYLSTVAATGSKWYTKAD